MNRKSEQPADKTTGATIQAKAELLISEFERLLASEIQLLTSGQVEGLEAIAEAKGVLIQQIVNHQADFIDLFNEHPQREGVQDLKKRLAQCRSQNHNNHALVMLELKHTNKSLELLRSVLKMDDLHLYSENGEVEVKREKRHFGSA